MILVVFHLRDLAKDFCREGQINYVRAKLQYITPAHNIFSLLLLTNDALCYSSNRGWF